MLELLRRNRFFGSAGRSETAVRFGFRSWTPRKAEKARLNR
ncbi:hypothetical protein ACFOU2_07550 [Bacillus songklensis]|uniref:Uncharacterized protein n=1 Tax=Bacillus songklensis TaxID=1069116 RepID=A0ABV8AZI2_9BACI